MEVKEIIEVLTACGLIKPQQKSDVTADNHPMLGRRCIIRTYSAGVHIGTVAYVNPSNSMEVKLTDALLQALGEWRLESFRNRQ